MLNERKKYNVSNDYIDRALEWVKKHNVFSAWFHFEKLVARPFLQRIQFPANLRDEIGFQMVNNEI